MADKILEILTEEERKLHEEFVNCKDWAEVEEFLKKVENLDKSKEDDEIPYYDMTIEEYRKKFHTTSYEEMKKRMCGECDKEDISEMRRNNSGEV